MDSHDERLKKQLYCLLVMNESQEDEEITFVAAFKTSKQASLFKDVKYKNKRTIMITPFDLPKKYETFFDQYKYCADCDKYPGDFVQKGAYLVKVEHSKYSSHFDSVFAYRDDVELYKRKILNGKKSEVIPLKLSDPSDDFFYNVQNRMIKTQRCEENKRHDMKMMYLQVSEIQRDVTRNRNLLLAGLVFSILAFMHSLV